MEFISIIIVILAISLTVNSIDTLINAVSSLIIVDGNKVFKGRKDYLKFSKQIIIMLSIIAFVVTSKGLSILYLFLLADLLCCAAMISVFYGFYYIKSLVRKSLCFNFIWFDDGFAFISKHRFFKINISRDHFSNKHVS